jgi:hypothetical protein
MTSSKLVVSAATAISTILGINVATAADLAARPYAKAPVYNAPPISWTGFYIGANGGGAWGRRCWTFIDTVPTVGLVLWTRAATMRAEPFWAAR